MIKRIEDIDISTEEGKLLIAAINTIMQKTCVIEDDVLKFLNAMVELTLKYINEVKNDTQ